MRDAERRKRTKFLFILGVFLTILGIILSFSSMFYSSPRYNVAGVLTVPGEPIKIALHRNASERIYYILSKTSNTTSTLNVTMTFYGEGDVYLGGKFFENLSEEEKGSIVLSDAPEYAVVTASCKYCNATIRVTLYYSIIDWNVLAVLSISGAIASLAGLVALFTGLSIYMSLVKGSQRSILSREYNEENKA